MNPYDNDIKTYRLLSEIYKRPKIIKAYCDYFADHPKMFEMYRGLF